MEVSGRQYAGSDDTNTGHSCDPCESAGETENAENYCVDCREFFCLTCAKVHRRQAISKGHQLLGRDEMPKEKHTIPPENMCRKHEGKPYDYICKNHNILCCFVCLDLDHRQCAAEYITDMTEIFESSESLLTKMRNLDELIGETKTRSNSNIAESKRSADQLVFEIKNFRAEINKYLDSLEKNILVKVNQVKDESIQAMSAIVVELDSMKAELDDLIAKLDERSTLNQKKELVIASRLACEYVNTMENRVDELKEQNYTRYFEFRRAEEILDLLQSADFGKLEELKRSGSEPVVRKKIAKAVEPPQSYNINHQRDIEVKHKEDKEDCSITGSVMMDTGRLAIADAANNSIKVVDAHQGNILSYIRLSSWPFDITYTDQDQLVVTAPSVQKLIFLDVSKTLTVNKELGVDGYSYGIDCTRKRLIVSFIDPGSVKILNMDGHILSSISIDPNGKPFFSCPRYVISSADILAFYVSDSYLGTVTKLAMTGKVSYEYTSSECKGLCCIVVDQYDNLYAAGRDSSTLCILSADGRQINTINVECPVSVALCEETDEIFISHGHGSSSMNSLSVYKLH